MKSRLRFVFDTNVLVSTVLVEGGKAQQAFLKADRNGFFLVSEATLDELEEVIYRERFDKYITKKERDEFLHDLLAKSIHIPIIERVTACSDPDDDMFLEVAVNGQADYIITGNTKDFPPSPFRDIPILRPAEFLALELPE